MTSTLLRASVTAAAALSVVVAGAATAAPKKVAPSCNLLTDDKGDGTGFVLTDADYLPNNPNLDVVSGDIAATAKDITAVIRLDALTATDPQSPTGRTYYANFIAGGEQLFLTVALGPNGAPTWGAGYIDGRRIGLTGAVTGVVDTVKKEVRITAPLSVFESRTKIKPGTKILDLNALAQRFVGAGGAGATPSADAAVGGKTYVVGAPSCVAVGK